MNKNIIVLMGIKHCGKTTQGKRIAAYLKCDFFDTDEVLFTLTGKSAREIYSQNGKEEFMNQEAKACEYILKQIPDSQCAVIATGGGFCNNEKAVSILKNRCKFVFMQAEEKVAADRIIKEIEIDENGNMKNLPAYIAVSNPKNYEQVCVLFHNFYEERVRIYSSIADISIKMPSASKEENTKRLLTALQL